MADEIILPNGKLDYRKLRLIGRAGYWDYGVMEDTFAMKVPGVSAARMAAMEGRKPNEADLKKTKRKTAYDQLYRNDPGAFTVCSAGI